jgi:cytochrome c
MRQALLVWMLAALCLGSLRAEAEGDAARGARVFQRCFACHSVDPNETAKLQGPSLYRIVGRPAARTEGFEYSDALKSKAASGLVWTEDALDRYVTEPERVIPGTRMAMPGLDDAQDRADLMAYLLQSGRHAP